MTQPEAITVQPQFAIFTDRAAMEGAGDRIAAAHGHHMRYWMVDSAGGPSFARQIHKIHGYCARCGALGTVLATGRVEFSSDYSPCTGGRNA